MLTDQVIRFQTCFPCYIFVNPIQNIKKSPNKFELKLFALTNLPPPALWEHLLKLVKKNHAKCGPTESLKSEQRRRKK